MKRILILLLAVICAASILAGCGNRNNSGGNNPVNDKALEDAKDYAKDQVDKNIDNKEDAEKAKEMIDSMDTDWPADKLPDGMPVYPDGEIFTLEADGNITIQISGTSKKSFDDYREELIDAGWEAEAIEVIPDAFNLTKDGWNGTLIFSVENVTIMLMKD